MKNIKRFAALLLCGALLVGAVAGCTTPDQRADSASEAATEAPAATAAEGETQAETEAPAATGEKVLTFSQTVDPPTLDPHLMNAAPAQVVGAHIFEPLLRSHEGEIVPGAAESYDASEDGLTYTFHLRDFNWSDGQPVTAGQYEYGIKRLMDPAVASPFSFIGMVIKNGTQVNAGEMPLDDLAVKAIDDKTLEITLEYPAPYFLGMLGGASFVAAREDMVTTHGANYASSAETNVYNGPFVVESWTLNDRVVLRKNENYWDKDVVKLDKVEILTVPDANTALGMYEAGDLDFVELPREMAAQYPDANYYYSGAADYLKLNMREGYATANKNLRLALEFGISRKDYVTLAHSAVYEGNQRFVLPQVQGVSGEYGTEYPFEAFPLEGDLEKAKEYLAAALTEMGLSDPSEISIELLTSDTETSRVEAEVIQAQYETNLGIQVPIRQVPYRQRLEMETAGDFTMVFTGWIPDYSDPYAYLELWLSDGPYNHGQYKSDAYDKACNDANASTDAKTRMDLLFEAEKIFCEDGVCVPLQLRRIPYLMNEKLTGFTPYFVGLQYDFMLADITE